MKKLPLLFCIVFLLTSCGEDSETSSGSGLAFLESQGFSLYIPEAWEVIPTSDIAPISEGTLELAYRSASQDRDFLNNIVIVSEEITTTLSSSDYAKRNVYLASRGYASLRDIQSKNITFADEDSSRLYIFEAQYQPQFPKTLFFQTAKICNTKAYVITIGLDTSVSSDVYGNYETIIQSFTCK